MKRFVFAYEVEPMCSLQAAKLAPEPRSHEYVAGQKSVPNPEFSQVEQAVIAAAERIQAVEREGEVERQRMKHSVRLHLPSLSIGEMSRQPRLVKKMCRRPRTCTRVGHAAFLLAENGIGPARTRPQPQGSRYLTTID